MKQFSQLRGMFLSAIRLDEEYLIALLSQLNFYEECPYTSQRGNTLFNFLSKTSYKTIGFVNDFTFVSINANFRENKLHF